MDLGSIINPSLCDSLIPFRRISLVAMHLARYIIRCSLPRLRNESKGKGCVNRKVDIDGTACKRKNQGEPACFWDPQHHLDAATSRFSSKIPQIFSNSNSTMHCSIAQVPRAILTYLKKQMATSQHSCETQMGRLLITFTTPHLLIPSFHLIDNTTGTYTT